MITPVLAGLALLVAQAAASSSLIVPDARDLTIKTRRTIDRPGAAVTTEILYVKGARQRREVVVDTTTTWIHITQCDERRFLSLYPDARTYAYEPIEATPRGMALGAGTMTIDAVDTGERRRFGHYVARRVITTRTIQPAPESVRGAGTRTRASAGVRTQDGWYIDVPPPNCIDRERPGYPIEETHRFSEQGGSAVVTFQFELSEAPLDDALFTVPDGYRRALPRPYGGYDVSKPDTVMNRLDSYRDVIAAWTNYVRRHGLGAILSGMRPSPRY